MIKLYQFPFSPFCEKTRWALDYKGLPYQVHNLLPGLHMLTTRQLAEKSSVPILVHGSVVVQDSPVILDYLDLYWRTRMLTPMDALEAKQACEWEGYLDEEIGVPLRLWFYWHVLRDWPRAMHFLLLDTPWHQGLVFRAMFPLLRPAIFRFMGIDDLSSRSALDRFLQALDVLDQQIQTRLFLVGSQFSRADLTACALLAPFVGIGQSEQQLQRCLPDAVWRERASHLERPCFDWVRSVYRSHRLFPESMSHSL